MTRPGSSNNTNFGEVEAEQARAADLAGDLVPDLGRQPAARGRAFKVEPRVVGAPAHVAIKDKVSQTKRNNAEAHGR